MASASAKTAAPAARVLEEVGAGTSFGGAGWSQGGGASAAVAELDPTDYGDLKLVGTVCMSPVAAEITFHAPLGPVMQSTPANADKWREAIKAGSAGTRKPVAPVLLCIDSFAGGTAAPVPWQKAYANKVKELGGTLEIKDYPRDDHFSLPTNCALDARRWLNDLF